MDEEGVRRFAALESATGELHQLDKQIKALQAQRSSVNKMLKSLQQQSATETAKPAIQNDKTPSLRTVQLPLSQNVKLNKTENAWKPKGVDRKQIDSRAEQLQKVRALLNKLSPNNIDKLKAELEMLELNSTDEIEGVAKLIFDKVRDEPQFCHLYANITQHIISKRDSSGDTETGRLLRAILVKQLQEEFEKIAAFGDEEGGGLPAFKVEAADRSNESIMEERTLLKKRWLGVTQIIAELYVANTIPIKIVVVCMDQLMPKMPTDSDKQSGKCTEACELKLELLCKLITIVGRNVHAENYNIDAEPLKILSKFRDLLAKQSVGFPLRFLMQDVLEEAKFGWKQAAAGKNQIKTVNKIREEYLSEKEALAQSLGLGKKGRNKNFATDSVASTRKVKHDGSAGTAAVKTNMKQQAPKFTMNIFRQPQPPSDAQLDQLNWLLKNGANIE